MPELGTFGSVRGVLGDRHSYRDPAGLRGDRFAAGTRRSAMWARDLRLEMSPFGQKPPETSASRYFVH